MSQTRGPRPRSPTPSATSSRARAGRPGATAMPARPVCRANARRARRLIAVSLHDRDEAVRLLGVEPSRVEVISNGVDVGRFDRRARRPRPSGSRDGMRGSWTIPRGWDASGVPGSVRYAADDLAAFVDPVTGEANPVLLFVGRFLAFKRVAAARARLPAGAVELRAPGAARDLGRAPRGVGGRASGRRGAGRRSRRNLLHRLAGPR